jgi:hypothetical protein
LWKNLVRPEAKDLCIEIKNFEVSKIKENRKSILIININVYENLKYSTIFRNYFIIEMVEVEG